MNGAAPTEPHVYLPDGHGQVGVGGHFGLSALSPAAELATWPAANTPSKPLKRSHFFICYHLRCLNYLVARNRECSTRFHAFQTVVGAFGHRA